MSPIFLIGGSGFVGRHVAVALLEAEQRVAAPSHDEFDIAREEPAALARKTNPTSPPAAARISPAKRRRPPRKR